MTLSLKRQLAALGITAALVSCDDSNPNTDDLTLQINGSENEAYVSLRPGETGTLRISIADGVDDGELIEGLELAFEDSGYANLFDIEYTACHNEDSSGRVGFRKDEVCYVAITYKQNIDTLQNKHLAQPASSNAFIKVVTIKADGTNAVSARLEPAEGEPQFPFLIAMTGDIVCESNLGAFNAGQGQTKAINSGDAACWSKRVGDMLFQVYDASNNKITKLRQDAPDGDWQTTFYPAEILPRPLTAAQVSALTLKKKPPTKIPNEIRDTDLFNGVDVTVLGDDTVTGINELLAYFPLGNIVYGSGAYSDFASTYDQQFGALTDITFPVPGAQEFNECTVGAGFPLRSWKSCDSHIGAIITYLNPKEGCGDNFPEGENSQYYPGCAMGFSRYFSPRLKALQTPSTFDVPSSTPGTKITRTITTPHPGGLYYSFDFYNRWHFVVLNTVCDENIGDHLLVSKPSTSVGKCSDITTDQYLWLKNDLENNKTKCTAVMMHHPFLSTVPSSNGGSNNGIKNNTAMSKFWQLFVDNDVDFVASAHHSYYQRYDPVDASGKVSDGPRQFIIGHGGRLNEQNGTYQAGQKYPPVEQVFFPSCTVEDILSNTCTMKACNHTGTTGQCEVDTQFPVNNPETYVNTYYKNIKVGATFMQLDLDGYSWVTFGTDNNDQSIPMDAGGKFSIGHKNADANKNAMTSDASVDGSTQTVINNDFSTAGNVILIDGENVKCRRADN